MSRTASYEIGLVFCNEAELTKQYRDAAPATKEYGQALAEAITQPYPEPRKHIKKVLLTTFTEYGEPIKTVDSGVFECNHEGKEQD